MVATEFIKLLSTGSSHLATEQYVDDAIAEGGGGGGVQPQDVYTQAEVNALLNNKLNVINPQDVIGNLRLDPTNGNSKIILNATSPPNNNDDFYCNGSAHINGTLRVSLLTSDGDLNADGVNADVFNSNVITNDIVFNHNDVEYMRFQASDNTVRVPNTKSFLSQNIFTDIIKPIAYGNDLICYGSNAANTDYIEYWKLNHAAETIDISKVLRVDEINTLTNTDLIIKRYGVQRLSITSTFAEFTGAVHCGNQLVVDTAKKLTMAPYAFGGVNHFDIRNNHTANPMIRFRCGLTGEITCMEITTSYVNLKKDLTIENTVKLKTNTIDTNDDNDLIFKRNDVPFMTLDKFTEDVNGTPTEIEAIICSKQLRANSQIRVNNLQINQFSSGVQFADIRLENADSVMRFYVGNSTSANFQITNAGITLGRETTISNVKTNIIDTNGDNDLTIRRNGTNVLNIFTYTPTNGPTIIVDAQSDCGISSSWMFANVFANRTGNTDTEFRGAISGGLSSGKVYMTYLHATETLDFDCSIDNTGRSVIGNILDTTVSDERLKTNIKDIESNFTECVKNVKVKTFEYTEEKYKNNDKYGFIAQNLLANLPKEFKSIVKENKEKDSDDKYLSINYMKVNLLLWGCCQEQQSKIEHLESRLFELEDIVKEMRGKGNGEKPKPKAKSKSKSKAKNVD